MSVFGPLGFNTETKQVIQIGNPMKGGTIGLMYSSIANALGINGFMSMKEVTPDELGEFVKGAKALGFAGISITMPLKSEMVKYIDEVDEIAKIYGAVNVVRIDADGHTKGFPFDCYGLVGALENCAGLDLASKRVMMIGAGSICGPISYNLAKHGVTHIDIVNRTLSKAEAIKKLTCEHTGITIDAYEMTRENLDMCAGKCDILLQCTSLGMHGTGTRFEYLGFLEKVKKDAFVFDVISQAGGTELTARAGELGLRNLGGIYMILSRVGLAFEQWFGIKWGKDEMDIAMKVWEDLSK